MDKIKIQYKDNSPISGSKSKENTPDLNNIASRQP